MSQDLSIVITSVYTLADIQTDTLNGEPEDRQHGAQNDVRVQQLTEYPSSAAFCSSGNQIGNSTTKHNPASLKHFDVSGSTKHPVQREGNKATYTWNGTFATRNSHRSVFDGDGAMTLSVTDSCPSFCCRRNDALVRKLRAKSRLVDDLNREPFSAVESGDCGRAKRSTNVCDGLSGNKGSNRVLPVASQNIAELSTNVRLLRPSHVNLSKPVK